MIWYQETLSISQAPPDSKTELMGIYDPKGDDIIAIKLAFESSEIGHIEKIVYSHNPSMLRQEEPSKDDIYYKYAAKINKIKNKYTTYEDIKILLQISQK